MSYNLPHKISTEKDLNQYESFLLNDIKEHSEKPSLKNLLEKHIGKSIKLDIKFVNRLESKSGILRMVGSDFILIENNCQKSVIPLENINFINLPRGN